MLIRIAVAVYLACSILLIAQQPGLQYDEALLVSDAVYMSHFPGRTTQPHDPHTWACAGEHCLPLMTVRYVGPIKTFLCWPLSKIFGANTEIIRIVSMLLAALGVWGFAALIENVAGKWAGGAAGLALALNPTYVNMTVFDNNAIAAMMAALGLLCFAIRSYLRRPSTPTAAWIGAAMGFGVWARANYLWLLVALCVATILILHRDLRKIPLEHLLWAIAAGIFAGLPFVVYQVVSRGGTWQGLGMFVEHGGLWQRLQIRWYLLTELLWTDREHRAMWGGPDLYQWQRWLSFGIVTVATALALWKGSKPARIVAIMLLVLTAIMLPSRLQLSEHHLILLLPVAVALTILAAAALPNRWIWGALAAFYFVSCSYWEIAAARGLARTGGVGMWSDAIYDLSDYLEDKYKDRPVQILDWSLASNLFVLSQARLHVTEIYYLPMDWNKLVRQGGFFLTTAPDNRHFPEATAAFMTALKKIAPATPIYEVRQKSGAGYALLMDVPAAAGAIAPQHLTGFYAKEQNGWRWAKKNFSFDVDLAQPRSLQLTLGLYQPAQSFTNLGPVTLTAKANGKDLPEQTSPAAGAYTFAREIPAAWLHSGVNRFEFSLDKSLPPSGTDPRELGVIVTGLAISPR